MTNWTKGPWAKDRSGSLRSPKGKQIGVWDAGIAHVFRDRESEANAHLIAAAPELYESLANALAAGLPEVVAREARAALYKARGKQ